MLDVKILRENFEEVKKNLEKRKDKEIISKLNDWQKKDEQWRKLKNELEELKRKRNQITDEIKIAKANKKDTTKLLENAKIIPQKIKENEPIVKELEEELKNLLMRIPNTLHESVPFGENDTKNIVIQKWGTPIVNKELIHHGQIAVNLDIAEFERAVKISGSGFYYLKGDLAMLDLALQRFALDLLIKKGFTPLQTPLIMSKEAYQGVTDLGDFENVMYKLDGSDSYLIATSEHSTVSMYMNEILEENDLENPIKYASMSPCFRKEIGRHGLDERGFFRVHQFNKIEQVIICKPNDSWEIFEEISKNQQEFFQALEIPYQIVNVCTGDIGIVAAKKYDLEAWSPREGKYIELGSCSNCTTYQAVRLNIKYRKSDGEKEFVHTLNNTMIATARTLRIILEQYQDKDGNLIVPKALIPYMNGQKIISKIKK